MNPATIELLVRLGQVALSVARDLAHSGGLTNDAIVAEVERSTAAAIAEGEKFLQALAKTKPN